jgi:PPK2 family polyphosphate:nucleotide phosphotransferase
MPIHRVRPGSRVQLARVDPEDTGRHADEASARTKLASDIERLTKLQDALHAEHRHAILVVLQGLDTAGKDGTVKHVMSGLNPSACQVVPFKVPTEEEAEHDFLWRAHRATPRRGHITIFNRSHYEDVLVPRVHRTVPRKVLKKRYDQINAFERILVENGTVILKFYLHISKSEQSRRLRDRLADASKRWKFNVHDLVERKLWDDYIIAYEKLLGRCSTKEAPWYVVPANKKWYRNLAVAETLRRALDDLHPTYPASVLSPNELRRLRSQL